jgi:hypothetical protein
MHEKQIAFGVLERKLQDLINEIHDLISDMLKDTKDAQHIYKARMKPIAEEFFRLLYFKDGLLPEKMNDHIESVLSAEAHYVKLNMSNEGLFHLFIEGKKIECFYTKEEQNELYAAAEAANQILIKRGAHRQFLQWRKMVLDNKKDKI